MQKTPYWWDASHPQPTQTELPETLIDVVVVGGGFTGLNAALTLNKAGKSVVVLDTEAPGFGASSRNGGMVGNLLKPGVGGLVKEYGLEKGCAIAAEAVASVSHLQTVIAEQNIDCDLNLNGRQYPAVLKKHLSSMIKETELRVKYLNVDEEIVGAEAIKEDVTSDLYVGGVRQHGTGGLHPAKYVEGLVRSLKQRGVVIAAPCRAEVITKKGSGFEIQSSTGLLRCSEVLMATNGYGGGENKFLQRRVMPIGSTMIATEALDPQLVKSLFPTSRVIADSRQMLSYYRPSPDGKHILLGGRPTIFPAAPEIQAYMLQKRLVEIFPVLKRAEVSHVWAGNVAYGFTALPTIGKHEGIHYALGYCGSGVAMSGYLGHKVALQMLGDAVGETAFDDLPFPKKIYYRGKPWFVPIAMIGYAVRDRVGF